MLREEVCRPLGIEEDMFCGIDDGAEPRVATLEEIFGADYAPPAADDPTPRDVPGWMLPLYATMNRADVRRACIPASNGIMTAHALARHYAALLPGGVDGVELLPPGRLRAATERQRGTDDPPQNPSIRCLGYLCEFYEGRITGFGHPGYGGSIGYAVPEHRLAVGFTKNLYSPAAAHEQILRELHAALGVGW